MEQEQNNKDIDATKWLIEKGYPSHLPSMSIDYLALILERYAQFISTQKPLNSIEDVIQKNIAIFNELKTESQKPLTDKEIEALAASVYKLNRLSTLPQCNKAQLKRAAFIKGYKASLNNSKPITPNIEQALQKIAQMSDSGNPENTIIEMKKIASDALKLL